MLMLSEPQRDLVRDRGTVLGRVLIGLLFLVSGLAMVIPDGTAGTVVYFTSLGIPMAGVVVWLVIVTKVVFGALIIAGKRVGLASAVLIGFTVIATLIATPLAHTKFSDPNMLKNLAIIGGLLYLMAYGPGGSNTHNISKA